MTFHLGYWLTDAYDLLYGKNVYYMYVMSIYHLLIPLWMRVFNFNKPMTFAVIDPMALSSTESVLSQVNIQSSFVAISWAVIIVLMDMFFLASLKWHFHQAKVQLFKRGTTNILSTLNLLLTALVIFGLVFYFGTLIQAVVITIVSLVVLLVFKYFNMDKLQRLEPYTINFLSWTNITRVEILVFFLSLYSMALREIMLFLSINTIQITIAYVIMSKIPFGLGRVLMISAAYLFLIKLLIWPIV